MESRRSDLISSLFQFLLILFFGRDDDDPKKCVSERKLTRIDQETKKWLITIRYFDCQEIGTS